MNIEEIRAEIQLAYEAGLKRGGEISLSSLNEVELRGNPIYQKGYEAGKADGQKSGVLFNAAKQAGFDEAAKDPKAWYVLDKKGEPVHIEDKATLPNGVTKTIKALGNGGGYSTNSIWIDIDKCEKVIPDSWDKWANDLHNEICSARLSGFNDEPYEGDWKSLVARAKALAEVD